MTTYCKVAGCRFPFSHTSLGHQCGSCNVLGHGVRECRSTNMRNNLINNVDYNIKLPHNLQCTNSLCLKKEYHTNDAHHCSICDLRHNESECNMFSDNVKVSLKCPLCRTDNELHLSDPKAVSTDKCSICLEELSDIEFPNCGHVCVCSNCLVQLWNNCKYKIITKNDGQYDQFDEVFETAANIFGNQESKIYTRINVGMGSLIYLKRNFYGDQIKGFFMHNDCWGQYGPATSEVPYRNHFLYGYKEIVPQD